MNRSIPVTSEAVSALRNAVAIVADARQAEHHGRAAARYRDEREAAAPDEPWWIDIGGEGESC